MRLRHDRVLLWVLVTTVNLQVVLLRCADRQLTPLGQETLPIAPEKPRQDREPGAEMEPDILAGLNEAVAEAIA